MLYTMVGRNHSRFESGSRVVFLKAYQREVSFQQHVKYIFQMMAK